jgi:hypothetical protein
MGEKAAAAGSALLIIFSFFPWYKISFEGFEELGISGGSVSANALEAPGAIWGIIAFFAAIAMLIAILGPKFANLQLPALGGVTWGQAFLGLGALALLCVIIKFVNESSYLSIGFYLGFLAALAMAGGGYLLFAEEKGTSPFGGTSR